MTVSSSARISCGAALKGNGAFAQDIGIIAVTENAPGILFDDGQRDALAAQFFEGAKCFGDKEGREAGRRLVEQHELGPRQPAHGDGQHLALAAAQLAGFLGQPFLQGGEESVALAQGSGGAVACQPAYRQQQVLVHRHGAKDILTLRHVRQPKIAQVFSPPAEYRLAVTGDRAAHHVGEAKDGLEQRGFPAAVGPKNGDKLAGSDVEIDGMEDFELAIAGGELADGQHLTRGVIRQNKPRAQVDRRRSGLVCLGQ